MLVLSAGSTTITELYSFLVEDMASRGFVVIGYGPTVIGNGTWQGDVTHVLDQLGVWNMTRGQVLFGRLDLDHPGAVPPGDGPAIPALILRSEDSAFASRYPDIEQERAATQHEFLRRAKPGIQITLIGAVHLSFTDMAVIKAFGLPGDGEAFVATTRAAIGEFFGQYLEGKHSELIAKGSAKYSLAKIQPPAGQ